MTEFQRARQPEQKQQRLTAIMQAAGTLFETQTYDEVSMQKIAKEAGLGKASLYHYFQTKEEVFMEVFLQDASRWVVALEARVRRLRKPTAEKIAAVIASLLVEHSRCARLISLVSSVLERNVSVDKLRSFKLQLLEPMVKLRQILVEALPDLTDRVVDDFLFYFHVVVAGLWPLTHHTEDYLEAIDTPELRHFQAEFEPHCARLFARLLRED